MIPREFLLVICLGLIRIRGSWIRGLILNFQREYLINILLDLTDFVLICSRLDV